MEQKRPYLLRVVMLPWLAHGHISSFFELSKRLARRNCYVYLCSTNVNLSLFKDQLEPGIELIEIHLPNLPNLPPHYHTTRNLPIHLTSTLNDAFDSAKPAFSDILRTLNPDCIIHDPPLPWATLAAIDHNIPSFLFASYNAATFSLMLHFARPSENITEFPFPTILVKNATSGGNGKSEEMMMRFFRNIISSFRRSSNICAIKTCREIEGKFLDYLCLLTEKEMIPLGLLFPQVSSQKENQPNMIIEWIERKPRGSVVFVSFGSEYFMSKEEIAEVGEGLELSGRNFVWVVRFPKDGKEPERIEEVLPCGFLERVGEKGMVVMDWVNQVQILNHPSIGGFVTHCGWGSTTEGLRLGVPLITLPFESDQPINAKLAALEWGVGVEIEREMGGNVSFRREKLAKGIKLAMVEKEGESVRMAAKKMGECLSCKGEEEIDVFVERLLEACKLPLENRTE